MNKTPKPALTPVPSDWKVLLDEEQIGRALSRICYEILERNRGRKNLAVVGIRTAGEHLARRIHKKLEDIEGGKIDYGVLDITLYRDDLSRSRSQPTLQGTELDFPVSNSRIVLVDDVFYTGRTIRAALDAIIDFGRPNCVELAVLADRGHRELPIRPDYIGKNLPTKKSDFVRVRLAEMGYVDGVYLQDRPAGERRQSRRGDDSEE